MSKNLFDYATRELSQDAFLMWIIDSYNSNDEICKLIGADSLSYISIKGVHELANDLDCSYCDGCFSGVYPIEVPKDDESVAKYSLSL